MDHKVRAVRDRAPVAAHGPHDHAVLIEDGGVLQLALVRITERDIGRVDQRRVCADRQEPQLARVAGAG